jgi:hypothetical protein
MNLMLFVKEFPALLDDDRMPINYRTFKAGVTTINRMAAVDQLKMSRAVRAGNSDVEHFEKWIEEKIAQAGMPKAPSQE